MCLVLGVRQGGSVFAKILAAQLSSNTVLIVEILSPKASLNLLQISASTDWTGTRLCIPVLRAIYFDSQLESAMRDWMVDFHSSGTPAKVKKKSRSGFDATRIFGIAMIPWCGKISVCMQIHRKVGEIRLKNNAYGSLQAKHLPRAQSVATEVHLESILCVI